MLLHIRSLAGYTIDTHESSFWKGQLTLDAATGTIGGTPTAPASKTSRKFTVTDNAVPAVSSTADLNLEIK